MSLNTPQRRLILYAAAAVFFQAAYAVNTEAGTTGTVRITEPAGIVRILDIEENMPLPVIPSGSTVELVKGSMSISGKEGSIRIIANDQATSVGNGDRITVLTDTGRQMTEYSVASGKVEIIAGNTTITVGASQRVRVGSDNVKETARVISVTGDIRTDTNCVMAVLPEGSAAGIRVDDRTTEVNVRSEAGPVEVVPAGGGAAKRLSEGETFQMTGCVPAEIQTFTDQPPVTDVPDEEEGTDEFKRKRYYRFWPLFP